MEESTTQAPNQSLRPAGPLGSAGASTLMTAWGRFLLLLSVLTGLATHGYHLFRYPLYTTDEGIYVQQAWAVLREHHLSPYTYFYDHAPGGWLAIAAWTEFLPRQFQTFGNAINTGRLLMLLVHVASVVLLFVTTRRLSGSLLAAFIATFLFNVSPLAIFYQREVLLDNLMVFWVLLALYLITRDDHRVMTPLLAGLAFGMALVTKENAIFFAPVLGYLLYRHFAHRSNRRFALGFWNFASLSTTSAYVMYAALKNELLPSHFNFNLKNPPADHVALLYTIWWQLHRSQGSILNPHSLIWQFSLDRWLPKDPFILIVGGAAMLIGLVLGLVDRQRNLGLLVAAGLAASYAFYLARGSLMLEFYVIPLLPFLAMTTGIVFSRLLRAFPRPAAGIAAIALAGVLLVPVLPHGGYVLVRDEYGKVVPHDLYKLDLATLQDQQIAYVRQHISPDAKLIIDDDMWAQLHDVRPYYRFAHSHWKAAGDPDVRDKLYRKDWHNVDYVVMSNKMLIAMQQNNGDGNETWIIDAIHHSQRVWDLKRGDIELEIYQVQNGGGANGS